MYIIYIYHISYIYHIYILYISYILYIYIIETSHRNPMETWTFPAEIWPATLLPDPEPFIRDQGDANLWIF